GRGERGGLPARRGAGGGQVLAGDRRPADGGEPAPELGERERDGPADAAQAAGDDDDRRLVRRGVLLYGQDDVILTRLDRSLSREARWRRKRSSRSPSRTARR